MKKIYESPELDILHLDVKDVLTNDLTEETWNPNLSVSVEEW